MKVKITKRDEDCWYYVDDVYEVHTEMRQHKEGYFYFPLVGEETTGIDVNDCVIVSKVNSNKYTREIKPGVYVDVYDVLRAFEVTDPCLQHLLKKALAAGKRGHKDTRTDYKDILDSAKRALEMHDEWNKAQPDSEGMF